MSIIAVALIGIASVANAGPIVTVVATEAKFINVPANRAFQILTFVESSDVERRAFLEFFQRPLEFLDGAVILTATFNNGHQPADANPVSNKPVFVSGGTDGGVLVIEMPFGSSRVLLTYRVLDD